MKKVRNIFILLSVILIVGILFFAMNIVVSKIQYKKWLNSYLSERYEENMNIKNIYVDQWGWSAEAYPECNKDLVFKIKAKVSETYLESSLEYEAEKMLNIIFPQYEIIAQMCGYEDFNSPFPELYQLYKQYGRPAQWNELPEYICLKKIRINTEQYMNNIITNDIIKTVSLADVKTSIIEIYDGDKLYTFKFDVSKNEFIPN